MSIALFFKQHSNYNAECIWISICIVFINRLHVFLALSKKWNVDWKLFVWAVKNQEYILDKYLGKSLQANIIISQSHLLICLDF